MITQSDGSTLFVDEIPLNVQSKLLRFLEDKRVCLLGEQTYKFVDVRIIATMSSIQTKFRNKRLIQEDLFSVWLRLTCRRTVAN